MKVLVFTFFIFFISCSTQINHKVRKPSSFKSRCKQLFEKLIETEEEPFEESRRKFMRGAAASMATASLGPTQLLKVAAQSAEAILPSRQIILKKAAQLRGSITIKGTETYSDALIRTAKNADFSEVSDILTRRAAQIQNRLGSSEVLSKVPKRVLQEGMQKPQSVVFDARIQKRLLESRKREMKLAHDKLLGLREDLINYLEASLIHQVNLFNDQLPEISSTLHLIDIEIVNKYLHTLKEIKELTLLQKDIYPKLSTTVDELLAEFE